MVKQGTDDGSVACGLDKLNTASCTRGPLEQEEKTLGARTRRIVLLRHNKDIDRLLQRVLARIKDR